MQGSAVAGLQDTLLLLIERQIIKSFLEPTTLTHMVLGNKEKK